MIDPAIIDRILVLAQVVLIFGSVAVIIRLVDIAVDVVRRQRARRRLQRETRLAARRHAWAEIDQINHDTRRFW